jgi:hypothetical protein
MGGNNRTYYVDNLGTETSWKATNWRTEGDNNGVVLREKCFENAKLIEVVQIRFQLVPVF